MATFYLDGTTLANSTSVFDDANLTTCAQDGFYSDGITSRELVNCILLPAQPCGTCAEPCGSTISASGGTGLYKLDIAVGGTPSDVGAIVIRFDPLSVPDGIRATFDGVVYNTLSGENDGYRTASPGGFNFTGNTGSDCNILANSPHTLTVFDYQGGSFQNTGTQEVVTVVAADMNLGGDPDMQTMVIPKTSALPDIVNIEAVGPCTGTGWNIQVNCPTILTGFQGSIVSSTLNCILNPSQTYYRVPVNGSASTFGQFDMIFQTENGANPPADGFINLVGDPHPWIEVQNGVIINQGTCVPNAYIIEDCDTGNLFTVSNSVYGGLSVNDVVQYQQGTPGAGTTFCGTITSKVNRATFDATLASGITYVCGDTVHCNI